MLQAQKKAVSAGSLAWAALLHGKKKKEKKEKERKYRPDQSDQCLTLGPGWDSRLQIYKPRGERNGKCLAS